MRTHFLCTLLDMLETSSMLVQFGYIFCWKNPFLSFRFLFRYDHSCELLRGEHLLLTAIQDCFKLRLMYFLSQVKASRNEQKLVSILYYLILIANNSLPHYPGIFFPALFASALLTDWASLVNYLGLSRTPFWPGSQKVLWDHWKETIISLVYVFAPSVLPLLRLCSSPQYMLDSFQLCDYFSQWFRRTRHSTLSSKEVPQANDMINFRYLQSVTIYLYHKRKNTIQKSYSLHSTEKSHLMKYFRNMLSNLNSIQDRNVC